MTARVIVVGSVNIDLVATVDHLPAPGETVTGARFAQHHGGKGGNQAVAAARLGAATWFVGAVGADDHGRAARAALDGEGVDTAELRTIPDATTGVALILVAADGENAIAVAGGANAALQPEHVRASLERLDPRPGDVVLVGHEISTATATEALRYAKAAGATTIFNPAPATGVGAETLALSDVLTPNQGEAAELAARGDAQALTADGENEDEPAWRGNAQADPRVAHGDPRVMGAALLAAVAGAGHILITLGGDGALLVGQDGALSIPAPKVAVIDTVGAGDTLNGALAAGIAAGLPLREATRRAVAAASLATTRQGAREGMPTAGELESLLTD